MPLRISMLIINVQYNWAYSYSRSLKEPQTVQGRCRSYWGKEVPTYKMLIGFFLNHGSWKVKHPCCLPIRVASESGYRLKLSSIYGLCLGIENALVNMEKHDPSYHHRRFYHSLLVLNFVQGLKFALQLNRSLLHARRLNENGRHGRCTGDLELILTIREATAGMVGNVDEPLAHYVQDKLLGLLDISQSVLVVAVSGVAAAVPDWGEADRRWVVVHCPKV
mmetsp:Transcript_15821/g.38988  ORF Transcript_15821/g.38988 Transcript_15821/m.38988 type:complete len:221 (-) Transcript_15821:2175-2837(-)